MNDDFICTLLSKLIILVRTILTWITGTKEHFQNLISQGGGWDLEHVERS